MVDESCLIHPGRAEEAAQHDVPSSACSLNLSISFRASKWIAWCAATRSITRLEQKPEKFIRGEDLQYLGAESRGPVTFCLMSHANSSNRDNSNPQRGTTGCLVRPVRLKPPADRHRPFCFASLILRKQKRAGESLLRFDSRIADGIGVGR